MDYDYSIQKKSNRLESNQNIFDNSFSSIFTIRARNRSLKI